MNRRDRQLAAALAAVPLAFAAGGAVVRVALRTPPKGIATDLVQPLPVVTAWHAYGGWLGAVLALSIAIATAAAIVAIADLRRRPPSRAAACAVFASAALALVAMLGWPVVFSSQDLRVRGVWRSGGPRARSVRAQSGPAGRRAGRRGGPGSGAA